MVTNKTRLEAYEKVLKGINDGKVVPTLMSGSCQYTYKVPGKNRTIHCGVGILFNQAQLKDLEKRGLNGWMVEDLITRIGELNITTVTGLDSVDLSELQYEHDDASDSKRGDDQFRSFVEHKIKKLKKKL